MTQAMKNPTINPAFKHTARQQSDGNRRLATGLALYALCLFVLSIVLRWLALR